MIRGLLADVNVAGHLDYLRQTLVKLDLLELMMARTDFRFATFDEVRLTPTAPDRVIWELCQQDGWILFTDNRNQEGEDSLEATLRTSWADGHLPVITLANKNKFESEPSYAEEVTRQAADLIFAMITAGQNRDQPRIFVPR